MIRSFIVPLRHAKLALAFGLAALAAGGAEQPVFAPTDADGANVDTPAVLAVVGAAHVAWGRYNLARALAGRGDARAATASLAAMIAGGLPLDCKQIASDHAFDLIQQTPPFAALIAARCA